VVDAQDVEERAGGAGLAACLAREFGAETWLIAPIAEDRAGDRLRALLAERGVGVLSCHATGTTVEKTRVRVGAQSLLRVDRGRLGEIRLPGGVAEALAASDAVLVSDYGCGTTGATAARASIAMAVGRRPIVWDPHPRGAEPVEGATIVTPNRAEAARFAGRPCEQLNGCITAARSLRTSWRVGAVAVTLGRDGAVLVTGPGAPLAVPVAEPLEGADCCGAGDAFSAAATIALGRGAVPSEAV
jgi:bifunctional ADP-heptose synthase (sugar kinase/adenylyltransferase)